VKSKV